MQVLLNNEIINVEIIRKNNKNVYFRFKDGKLVITCNRIVSLKTIKDLIKNNEKALYKMYLKNTKEMQNDLLFNYLGNKYTIIYDNITKDVYFDNNFVFTKDKKTLDKFYEKECIRIFQNEVNRIVPYFNNIPKFTLKIRKMKTRWGVNNITKRNITLNSELLKKKPHLLDYVIIHELCHFYEANHSIRFWNHVSKYYPKYKEARKELREV